MALGQTLMAALRHPRHAREIWAICAAFDADWYRHRYMGADARLPVVHFLTEGAERGFDPHQEFSSALYLARYPDVAQAGVNPFVHYCIHGRAEGRSGASDRVVAEKIWANAALSPSLFVPSGGIWLTLLVPDVARQQRQRVQAMVADQNVPGVQVLFGGHTALATGEWVACLDPEDDLAPQALHQVRAALDAAPDVQFLYTDTLVHDGDEDILHLKPAFDPALLAELHYTAHLELYRRDRWLTLGGRALDHEFCLTYVAELPDRSIAHLPYPAYVRQGPLAPTRSPPLAQDFPGVSIVIPTKDALPLIQTVLAGVFEYTDYPLFEVIVVDNGTKDPLVRQFYATYEARHQNFRTICFDAPFNFSQSVNIGIAAASLETVLLLNNDIEITDPNWLREMVSCLNIPGTGIVGPKLLFPNGTIQHAGVIAGFGDLAGHWYIGCPGNTAGMMKRLHHRNTMTCVTGAAMLITRKCLARVGAWDEDNFAVAYNDVDFCLRAYDLGIGVVWTPHTTLIHHESATRGYDSGPDKRCRFVCEQLALQRRHATKSRVDPTGHPDLSRQTSVPFATQTTRSNGLRYRFRSGES